MYTLSQYIWSNLTHRIIWPCVFLFLCEGGEQEVALPPGTQPGHTKILKSKGKDFGAFCFGHTISMQWCWGCEYVGVSTYCNILLQHTAATHCCNTSHCCNTLLQHYCTTLLATHHCNTAATHCCNAQLQHTTSAHYCNTLLWVGLTPRDVARDFRHICDVTSSYVWHTHLYVQHDSACLDQSSWFSADWFISHIWLDSNMQESCRT